MEIICPLVCFLQSHSWWPHTHGICGTRGDNCLQGKSYDSHHHHHSQRHVWEYDWGECIVLSRLFCYLHITPSGVEDNLWDDCHAMVTRYTYLLTHLLVTDRKKTSPPWWPLWLPWYIFLLTEKQNTFFRLMYNMPLWCFYSYTF